jgi:hypothetical protein
MTDVAKRTGTIKNGSPISILKRGVTKWSR